MKIKNLPLSSAIVFLAAISVASQSKAISQADYMAQIIERRLRIELRQKTPGSREAAIIREALTLTESDVSRKAVGAAASKRCDEMQEMRDQHPALPVNFIREHFQTELNGRWVNVARDFPNQPNTALAAKKFWEIAGLAGDEAYCPGMLPR